MIDILKVINENINGSFYSMDESVQLSAAEKVLDKVFSMTIGKYNKINFGDIEKTRGDITKLKFYKNLDECIKTLDEINNVTHKLTGLSTIKLAIDNMIKLKPNFEKSFRVQNNCGIMLYNIITYSIMESTSYLIATSINFLSNDEIIISDVNGSVVLIDSLDRFNKLAADGTVYRFISEVEKEVLNEGIGATIASFLGKTVGNSIKNLNNPSTGTPGLTKGGVVIAVSVTIIAIMIAIVPLIRQIVYFIYNTKHKISESAELQAAMLEMNIKLLVEKGESPKVIAKQQKWVERFRKLADKFSLDVEKGERDSKNEIKNDKIDMDAVLI